MRSLNQSGKGKLHDKRLDHEKPRARTGNPAQIKYLYIKGKEIGLTNKQTGLAGNILNRP
jgi:hypothetical protein